MDEGRDWLRMMREPCPDCGADAAAHDDDQLLRALTTAVAGFGRTLAAADPHGVRVRPAADVWSGLEYACHARDVIGVFEDRVRRTAARPGLQFGWWDHEAAALEDRYNEQVPVLVAEEMAAAARRLVVTLADLDRSAWAAPAERRPGEQLTIRGMARFVLHELVHHRWDAANSIDAAADSP